MIHLAGPPITVESVVRQRCAWCGGLLVTLNMSIPDWERQPWQPGSPITVDGDRQYMEQHPSDKIPSNACWSLDHEVTR